MQASASAMADDGEGEGARTPLLSLDGYNGALEGLLTLARSRRIDLGKIPLRDLVDQMVTAVGDHSLTLKYKEGEKKIVVGPDCPIVTYAPADKAELKPGAKIFINAATKEADGTLSVPRINVGRDAAPPM